MIGVVGFVLGVNEAVVAPAAIADPERLRARADLAAGLTDTVRVQSSTWPWLWRELGAAEADWARVEAAFRLLGDAGLSAVVVLAPWPANEPWTVTDDCRVDTPRYAANVTALVEALDGDGDRDWAGAARIVAWEVDNEPDLHDWLRPGFCEPATYAETLALTRDAVRAADPAATVLSGGVYRPGTATGLAWMRGVGPVDAVGLHVYPGDEGPAEAVRRALANAREAYGDAPVWITEASVGGDEAEQARGLVELVIAAWEGGAEGLFWHTLADPPRRGDRPGLLAPAGRIRGATPAAAGWREKPAAEAFRALRGLSGEVQGDGDLRWVRVDGGWLVWPTGRMGEGTPPGPVRAIAGGHVRMRGSVVRLRGLGFVDG